MPDRTRKAANSVWHALTGLSRPHDAPAEEVSALPGTALLRLRELAELGRHVEDLAAAEVQRALDAGETWEAVGNAVGLSRQGAHRRWAKYLRSRRLV